MPKYTVRGQQAANRVSTRNKGRIQAGQGRISHAMGKSDPRHRRNDQSAQATERRFNNDQFTVDKHGRVSLKESNDG